MRGPPWIPAAAAPASPAPVPLHVPPARPPSPDDPATCGRSADHRDSRVTQQLAHRVEIDTRLHQPAGEMMPQIVESEVFDARDLDQ